MPIFIYRCTMCEVTNEKIQSVSEGEEYLAGRPCCDNPGCDGEQKRIMGTTSFSLKGKGWERDGYK